MAEHVDTITIGAVTFRSETGHAAANRYLERAATFLADPRIEADRKAIIDEQARLTAELDNMSPDDYRERFGRIDRDRTRRHDTIIDTINPIARFVGERYNDWIADLVPSRRLYAKFAFALHEGRTTIR